MPQTIAPAFAHVVSPQGFISHKYLSRHEKKARGVMPLFTIVITCYNQRDFIRDAVESALVQPLCSREIIVVDDGSCDGSSELLNQYEESIQLIKLSGNEGAIRARNLGASL
ncbi:MAG: glycosyltransferase family 2 protein, partial [Puia sp.]|nr:glycosyltransferase family 2 protein [Puia sp.]